MTDSSWKVARGALINNAMLHNKPVHRYVQCTKEGIINLWSTCNIAELHVGWINAVAAIHRPSWTKASEEKLVPLRCLLRNWYAYTCFIKKSVVLNRPCYWNVTWGWFVLRGFSEECLKRCWLTEARWRQLTAAFHFFDANVNALYTTAIKNGLWSA